MNSQGDNARFGEAKEAGRILFKDDPTTQAAEAVVVSWLQGLKAGNLSSSFSDAISATSNGSPSLVSQLRDSGLISWSERVSKIPENPQSISAEGIAAQYLFHAAGSAIAADARHPDLFCIVDEVWSLCHGIGFGTDAEVSARLSRSPDALKRLAALLAGRVALISDNPDKVVFGVRGSLRSEAGTAPTTRDIWSGMHVPLVRDIWAYRAVRRLDPQKFLEIVECLPRLVVHAVVEQSDPYDFADLLRLIRTCALAYRLDGALGDGNVIFAVLESAETHLRRCAGLEPRASGTISEFDDVADQLVAALFSRSDAQPLGRVWLQRLIWESHSRRWTPLNAGAGVDREALWRLIDRIGHRLTPFSVEANAWLNAEEFLWRVDRLLVAAAVSWIDGRTKEAGDLISSAISVDSIATTGRESALGGDGVEARIVGAVISAQPDSVGWFKTLWANTYELRERRRIGAKRDVRLPGHVAIAWGLHSVHRPATPAKAAALWKEIAAAILETHVTECAFEASNTLLNMSTRLAGVFGAHLVEKGDLPAKEFNDFVCGLIEPTPEFANFVSLLFRNGALQALLSASHVAGKEKVRLTLGRTLAEAMLAKRSPLHQRDRDAVQAFLAAL